jgi:hypothetical protein
MIISVLAEISIGQIPNTSWRKCHRLSQCTLYAEVISELVDLQHFSAVDERVGGKPIFSVSDVCRA